MKIYGIFLLIAERSEMHHNLFRFHIRTDQHEQSDAALDGFCRFVGSFLDLSCIPCNFKGFKRLVLDLIG